MAAPQGRLPTLSVSKMRVFKKGVVAVPKLPPEGFVHLKAPKVAMRSW